jgi:hypothetical protein
MGLVRRVRIIESAHSVPRAIAPDEQHDCVFHGMGAWALDDDLHIASQFASPSPILGHDIDDSKPTGEKEESTDIHPCLFIGLSNRSIHHLDLPLVLGRGDVAVAHPLLQG